MALGADTAKVVTYCPVATKAWLDREAAKRGLTTSAYVRTLIMQMHSRAAEAA